MNPAGFSSEARAKQTSAQCCEHMGVHKHHILFSQAFPSPLLLLKIQTKQHTKTKPTPTATPSLKSVVTRFKLHTFVSSASTGLAGI